MKKFIKSFLHSQGWIYPGIALTTKSKPILREFLESCYSLYEQRSLVLVLNIKREADKMYSSNQLSYLYALLSTFLIYLCGVFSRFLFFIEVLYHIPSLNPEEDVTNVKYQLILVKQIRLDIELFLMHFQ